MTDHDAQKHLYTLKERIAAQKSAPVHARPTTTRRPSYASPASMNTAPQYSMISASQEWMNLLIKSPDTRTDDEIDRIAKEVTDLKVKYFQQMIDEGKDGREKFRALCTQMMYEEMPKDEPVFWQGDNPDKMYVILSGTVSCWIEKNQAKADYGDVEGKDGSDEEEDEKKVAAEKAAAAAAAALAAAAAGPAGSKRRTEALKADALAAKEKEKEHHLGVHSHTKEEDEDDDDHDDEHHSADAAAHKKEHDGKEKSERRSTATATGGKHGKLTRRGSRREPLLTAALLHTLDEHGHHVHSKTGSAAVSPKPGTPDGTVPPTPSSTTNAAHAATADAATTPHPHPHTDGATVTTAVSDEKPPSTDSMSSLTTNKPGTDSSVLSVTSPTAAPVGTPSPDNASSAALTIDAHPATAPAATTGGSSATTVSGERPAASTTGAVMVGPRSGSAGSHRSDPDHSASGSQPPAAVPPPLLTIPSAGSTLPGATAPITPSSRQASATAPGLERPGSTASSIDSASSSQWSTATSVTSSAAAAAASGQSLRLTERHRNRLLRRLYAKATRIAEFSWNGRQTYFGDIALLKDVKRTATIKCDTACQFLTISKKDFDKCMQKLKDDLAYKIKSLNKFHLFRAYKDEHRTKIAAHFQIKKYPPKYNIVTQGQEMSMIYFIVSGDCQLTYTFKESEAQSEFGGGANASAKKPPLKPKSKTPAAGGSGGDGKKDDPLATGDAVATEPVQVLTLAVIGTHKKDAPPPVPVFNDSESKQAAEAAAAATAAANARARQESMLSITSLATMNQKLTSNLLSNAGLSSPVAGGKTGKRDRDRDEEEGKGQMFGEERFVKRRSKDKVTGKKSEPVWQYGVRTLNEVEVLFIHFEDLKTRLGGGVALRLRDRVKVKENWRRERMIKLRQSRKTGLVAKFLMPAHQTNTGSIGNIASNFGTTASSFSTAGGVTLPPLSAAAAAFAAYSGGLNLTPLRQPLSSPINSGPPIAPTAPTSLAPASASASGNNKTPLRRRHLSNTSAGSPARNSQPQAQQSSQFTTPVSARTTRATAPYSEPAGSYSARRASAQDQLSATYASAFGFSATPKAGRHSQLHRIPQPPGSGHGSGAATPTSTASQSHALAAPPIPEVTTLPFSPLRAAVVANHRRQQQQIQAMQAAQAAAALHYQHTHQPRGGDNSGFGPESDELNPADFDSASASDSDSGDDDDATNAAQSAAAGSAAANGGAAAAPASDAGSATGADQSTTSPPVPYLNPVTKEAREKLRDVMRERMRWRHDIEKMREREAMFTGKTRHSSSAREWERVAMARSERKLPSPPPPPAPAPAAVQPIIIPSVDGESAAAPSIGGGVDIDPHALAAASGSVQAAAAASKAGIAKAIQHAREVSDIESMFHRSGTAATTTTGFGSASIPAGVDDVDDALSVAERAKFYLRSSRHTKGAAAAAAAGKPFAPTDSPNQKKTADDETGAGAAAGAPGASTGPERLLRFKGKTQFAAYRVRGERVQQKNRARIYKKLSQTHDLNRAIQNLGERESVPVVLTKLTRLPWRGNFEAFQVPLTQAFTQLSNKPTS